MFLDVQKTENSLSPLPSTVSQSASLICLRDIESSFVCFSCSLHVPETVSQRQCSTGIPQKKF